MHRWALLCSLILLTACSDAPEESDRTLRVVTLNSPTTYFFSQDGKATGPEHDLATAFAKAQDRDIEFLVVDTLTEVFDALENGKADLAAAGLSKTEEREQRFLLSRSYRSTQQQVVCRRGGKKARSVSELKNIKLAVVKNSSYEQRLLALQQKHKELTWESVDSDSETLLHRVWKKKIDCTVADSHIVAVNRRYLPELLVMFDLTKDDQLVWAMPKELTGLKRSVNSWLNSDAGLSRLQKIEDRYYSYIDTFDFVDTRALVRRIDSRLPKYRALFEAAAQKHKLSPTLLMAQAYQESHWNPKASSPTGVKGIMMLTRNTAKSLGVKNRLNPEQAIPAGAAYLAKMRSRFKEDIPEPDRTYLALAAYNLGRAHMHDAQTLARQLNKNPYSWADIESVLPLMSEKKYYRKLKYGYARGIEPVLYVQRIRNYQNIIEQKLKSN
nr:membrane-bound lytic murein transglycosylase MltF [Litorivivens lipolytica]